MDSARGNLASSLVNGFVNAGFGQDKLLTNDGNKWLYKNKGYGMMSATASLGLVLLWDVEGGLTQIDKFLYSTEDNIKVCVCVVCYVWVCDVCGCGEHVCDYWKILSQAIWKFPSHVLLVHKLICSISCACYGVLHKWCTDLYFYK